MTSERNMCANQSGEQFIQQSDPHHRLPVDSSKLHRARETEAASIRDIAEPFDVEGELMNPPPRKAPIPAPYVADWISAITRQLVRHDIACCAGDAELTGAGQ